MSRLLSKERVRDLLLGLALLCATLALMLYPQPSMEAAKSGLALCYNVIIPSLFPFFVLSSLVVELGLAGYLGRLLEGLMRPLFHVSGACASAFALGFIGGYPVGAKTAISLYENGMCTKTEADAAASICIGILFRFYKAGPTARREERQSRPQFHAQRFTTAFTGSIKNSFLSTLNICAFVVFFTVVIQLLIRSGFLPGLAQVLGTVLAPFGLTPEWAQRLLTGALEISSGVWTLSGDGTLSGKLILAAFMLGWAGISVHCQVLSFIGGSGLSVGTYLVGKLLHGGLSALFIAVLVRLFPLEAPVSDYLADQVAGIAGMDFHRTLVISLVCAWVLFLFFLFVAAAAARKSLGKRHRSVL